MGERQYRSPMRDFSFRSWGTHPRKRRAGVLMTRPQALMAVLIGFVLIGGLSATGGEPQQAVRGNGELQFLRQNGSIAVSITIDIADTPEARIKGLMERWSLPDLHGMLFIFDQPEVQTVLDAQYAPLSGHDLCG